jgi:hypothetical protein
LTAAEAQLGTRYLHTVAMSVTAGA